MMASVLCEVLSVTGILYVKVVSYLQLAEYTLVASIATDATFNDNAGSVEPEAGRSACRMLCCFSRD